MLMSWTSSQIEEESSPMVSARRQSSANPRSFSEFRRYFSGSGSEEDQARRARLANRAWPAARFARAAQPCLIRLRQSSHRSFFAARIAITRNRTDRNHKFYRHCAPKAAIVSHEKEIHARRGGFVRRNLPPAIMSRAGRASTAKRGRRRTRPLRIARRPLKISSVRDRPFKTYRRGDIALLRAT
jgi:hypothetical protein